MFRLVPRRPVKDFLFLDVWYRPVINVKVSESYRAVCLTNEKIEWNEHSFVHVIFFHVTVAIRKINPGKTRLKYGRISSFDEFEAHTIPIGAITILHVMRKVSSQNKGSLFKGNVFFPPLVFLVL